MFQSRSGFSPCCDIVKSWVKRDTHGCFNPVLGFLPVATIASIRLFDYPHCFNPVLGFLPVATRRVCVADRRGGAVSIPFWVFSLLRPEGGLAFDLVIEEFQSRSGFSPCCDAEDVLIDDVVSAFQSRSGFSPCCDKKDVHGSRRRVACFNPVLGFLPVATSLFQIATLTVYQVSIPFWVFSLLRPPSQRPNSRDTRSFNPVLGFLPVATIRNTVAALQELGVSIPFWVFSLLRRV